MQRPQPTSRERQFSPDDIIVSKTDLKGRLTYVNEIFCSVGLYEEEELLGQPHSIVRHPDMPRCVFRLLWERIQSGEEIFAYVKNMAKNGDFYWVLAHVTPSYDLQGNLDGYHSNRRVPRREALAVVEPIYRRLGAAEAAEYDRKAGLAQSCALLQQILAEQDASYDQFVLGLAENA